MHEDAADGGFVGFEGKFRHVDGFAHETLMVVAIGDGAEDHVEQLFGERLAVMYLAGFGVLDVLRRWRLAVVIDDSRNFQEIEKPPPIVTQFNSRGSPKS